MHFLNVAKTQQDKQVQTELPGNQESVPLHAKARGAAKCETLGFQKSALPPPPPLGVSKTASTRSPVRILTVTHPLSSAKPRKRAWDGSAERSNMPGDITPPTIDVHFASLHQQKLISSAKELLSVVQSPKVTKNIAAGTQGTIAAGAVSNVTEKKQNLHGGRSASSHMSPAGTHPIHNAWTTGDKIASADDKNWTANDKNLSANESWSKPERDWKGLMAMAWSIDDKKRADETKGMLPAAFGGPLGPEPMLVLPSLSAPPLMPTRPMDEFHVPEVVSRDTGKHRPFRLKAQTIGRLPPSGLPFKELQVKKVLTVPSPPVITSAKWIPCQPTPLPPKELQGGALPPPPASPFQREIPSRFAKRHQRVGPRLTGPESSVQCFGDAFGHFREGTYPAPPALLLPTMAPPKMSPPISIRPPPLSVSFAPKSSSAPPPVKAYLQKACPDSNKKKRRVKSPDQWPRSPQRPAPPRGLLQPFAPPLAEGAVSAACPCDKSAKAEDDVDEVHPAWLIECILQECADDRTYIPSQWTEWFKEHGIKSFWRYVPYDDKDIQGRREPNMTAEIVTDDPTFDLKPGTLVPISEERTSELTTYIKAAVADTEVWYFDRRPSTDLDNGGRLFERAYGSE